MSKPFCGSGSLSSADPAVVRPYLVGITGSRATGKSIVGKILQERHGVAVIDTDGACGSNELRSFRSVFRRHRRLLL